jgi:hypothetical protein
MKQVLKKQLRQIAQVHGVCPNSEAVTTVGESAYAYVGLHWGTCDGQ